MSNSTRREAERITANLQTKQCEECGIVIVRRIKLSDADWERKTTCSLACKGKRCTRMAKARVPSVKTCTTCDRQLPTADFDLRPNGTPYSRCCECRRVLNRVRYRLHPTKKPHKPSADPYKRQSRNKLQRAVRDGKIIPQPCEVCGGQAEAHHDDYDKPYDVRWLCRIHHGMEHWKPVSTPILAEAQRIIDTAIRKDD